MCVRLRDGVLKSVQGSGVLSTTSARNRTGKRSRHVCNVLLPHRVACTRTMCTSMCILPLLEKIDLVARDDLSIQLLAMMTTTEACHPHVLSLNKKLIRIRVG